MNSPATLADAGMLYAFRAARAYLERTGKSLHQADMPATEFETLYARIQAHVIGAMESALDDMHAALAIGNPHIAEQTFALSMALAGIEAAKEASVIRG